MVDDGGGVRGSQPRLNEYYEYARQDAAERGIPELETLLEMLHRATTRLRRASWADDATASGRDPGRHDTNTHDE